MKLARLVVSGGLAASSFLFSVIALAAPTLYTSRSTFETAFPGLGVETFQGKTTSAGCPSPISTDTPNSSCFDQGVLRGGFSIGGTESHSTNGISLATGSTGHYIGTSYYSDTTVLTLSPPQVVVGFDVYLMGGGAIVLPSGTTATVTAYDGSSAVIATTDVDATGFFGIRSDTPVAKVHIFRSGTYAEGLDNLAFGPSFVSVSPATAGSFGGSTVTLTGTGFNANTAVTIGGVAATDVVVTGGTSITCKAPAHAAGVVDVSLLTSGVSMTKASSLTYASYTASAALALTPKTPRYDDESNAFTATVTGTDPTGAVTLMEGTTELGEASLVSGTADLSAVLSAGTHSVFARYKGDAFHASVDSSPVDLEILAHPTPADAGSDAGGNPGGVVDSGTPSGTPDGIVSVADAGGSADPGDAPGESGCSASQQAPRAPFGLAMGLTLVAALAFARRRR